MPVRIGWCRNALDAGLGELHFRACHALPQHPVLDIGRGSDAIGRFPRGAKNSEIADPMLGLRTIEGRNETC